jgi:hypothetical protein
MLQVVNGGPYRCALVIRLEDGVDDELLAALADTTGLDFDLHGTGGFGGETVAAVYAAGENLLMEVLSDEVGAKALFVWADSAEHAVAVRDVIGAHMSAWSEPMLRAQLVDTIAEQPAALVPLMMAAGGTEPEPETLELLQLALDHDDEEVRQAAEYARLVASELVDPPIVVRVDLDQELQEILRPAQPVAGERNWITVRAGERERAVPRPVTWLSTPLDDPEAVSIWAYKADWDILVIRDQDDPDWFEDILAPMDGRTALHIVRHPALGTVHVALHGEAVEATAAALATDLGADILNGPPPGWERTAR